MDNLNCIIFDFDGTIADTLELAVTTYNGIASEWGCKPIEKKDKDLLRSQKPQEFLKNYGITAVKLPFLVLKMRKEIGKHVSEIKPVNGIASVLYEIKDAGFNLGILTSNSASNVKHFLEKNHLEGVFNFIHSSKHVFGKDKSLLRFLKTNNLAKRNVAYVGDETRDIEAAKKVGIPIVSVSWGFNVKETLTALLPDQLTDTPNELLPCIQRIFNGIVSIGTHQIPNPNIPSGCYSLEIRTEKTKINTQFRVLR
jgi:phosphoglycolate phosphatase